MPRRARRPKSAASCDRCGKERNTLFDLPDRGLWCVNCALTVFDENRKREMERLIRTAVSGVINLERRRRALFRRRAA